MTGCGPTTTGTGAASPASTAEESVSNPASALAPRVQHPRDARRISGCAALATSQLAELSLDPSSAADISSASTSGCRWQAFDRSFIAAVVVAVDLPVGGLEGVYLGRATFTVFEPDQVDGFPVVRTDRNGGPDCTLHVGPADDQLVDVLVSEVLNRSIDTCDAASRVASAVLSTLPPRSS
ncbi:DUF3558 family protein [Pseudonocardia acidicola]